MDTGLAYTLMLGIAVLWLVVEVILCALVADWERDQDDD